MAIAFNSQGGNFNPGPTTSDSFSFTNTAGNLLVYFGHTNSASGDVLTAVTYNGAALTKVTSHTTGTADQYISVWYLKSPATGSNTLAVTTSVATDIGSGCLTYTGCDTSSQPDSFSSGGSTGNLDLTTTVVSTGSWLVSASRNGSSGPMGAGAGTTIRTTGALLFDAGDSNGTVGTGAQTMSWTAGSNTSGGVIVSIAPPGAVVASASSAGRDFMLNNAS